MQLKTIAVVGPGGNVGSAIIKRLLEDGDFEVTAVVRPTSKYSPLPLGYVKIIIADFESRPSLVDALRGKDALVCCVGGTQTKFDQQKLLIDASIEASVKLFFASEYSGNILSPHYRMLPTQFVGEKLVVREYLEEKAAAGQMAWTALNGGPFFDMWLMGGPAGFDIPNRKAKIYASGDNLSCWTPLPTIAVAVVNMLRNPSPILNRGIFISGVLGLTQNSILAALEAETGEKFSVEHVDVQQIKKEALEALQNGEYRQATRGLAINHNFNEKDSAANFWDKVENELVGVKPVSVQEAVRAAIGSWQK